MNTQRTPYLSSIAAIYTKHHIMDIPILSDVFLLLVTHPSDGKESACNAESPGSIPGLGRSPGEGNGSTLQTFRYVMHNTESPVYAWNRMLN